jgi:hypothetical protein
VLGGRPARHIRAALEFPLDHVEEALGGLGDQEGDAGSGGLGLSVLQGALPLDLAQAGVDADQLLGGDQLDHLVEGHLAVLAARVVDDEEGAALDQGLNVHVCLRGTIVVA